MRDEPLLQQLLKIAQNLPVLCLIPVLELVAGSHEEPGQVSLCWSWWPVPIRSQGR